MFQFLKKLFGFGKAEPVSSATLTEIMATQPAITRENAEAVALVREKYFTVVHEVASEPVQPEAELKTPEPEPEPEPKPTPEPTRKRRAPRKPRPQNLKSPVPLKNSPLRESVLDTRKREDTTVQDIIPTTVLLASVTPYTSPACSSYSSDSSSSDSGSSSCGGGGGD